MSGFLTYGILNSIKRAEKKKAIYSLRRVNPFYDRPCIRVVRDNDYNEKDIGFDSNNELNIASLMDFVGSANAYVVVWYDQYAPYYNAINRSVINMPQIVYNGVLNTLNGKPAINADNDRFIYLETKLWGTIKSSLSVQQSFNTGSVSINKLYGSEVLEHNVPDSSGLILNRFGGGPFLTGQDMPIGTASKPFNEQYILTFTTNEVNEGILKVNDSIDFNVGTYNDISIRRILAGRVVATNHTMNGEIQELLLFKDKLTISERNQLIAESNNYFNTF